MTQEEIDREEFGCLQSRNGVILEKGRPYYSKPSEKYLKELNAEVDAIHRKKVTGTAEERYEQISYKIHRLIQLETELENKVYNTSY